MATNTTMVRSASLTLAGRVTHDPSMSFALPRTTQSPYLFSIGVLGATNGACLTDVAAHLAVTVPESLCSILATS